PSQATDPDAPLKSSSSFTTRGNLGWKAATLGDVAQSLTGFLKAPVVDMTGIDGRFDIKLDASPESLGMPSAPAVRRTGEPAPLYPSIFVAIQDLGLRLEPKSGISVKELVVDAGQKMPTGN